MPHDPKDDKRVSKLISLALRHQPEALGLKLDAGGWIAVEALLAGLRRRHDVTLADIERIAAEDEKGRYALRDGRIRANQGHSIEVELDLSPIAPPETLFHGTVERFLEAILAEGLRPQGRRHVHLSGDLATARMVGARRGRPVILSVASGAMAAAGSTFYRSENGVWLTDHVPAAALRVEGRD